LFSESDKNIWDKISASSSPEWLSLSKLSNGTPYSAEYLSLLARRRKLQARKVDNVWYSTKEALEDYVKKIGGQNIADTENNELLPLSKLSADTPYSAEYLSLLARKRKLQARKIDGVWSATRNDIADYVKKHSAKKEPILSEEGKKVILQNFRAYPEAIELKKVVPLKTFKAYADIAHEAMVFVEKEPVTHLFNQILASSLALILVFGLGGIFYAGVSGRTLSRDLSERVQDVAAVNSGVASAIGAIEDSVSFFTGGFNNLKDLALKKFSPIARILPGYKAPFVAVSAPAAENEAPLSQAAVKETAPVYTFDSLRSDLKTELESYIRTQLGIAQSPVTIYQSGPTYNTTVLRESILQGDTRPTVTRQSTSDVESLASLIGRLATDGIFTNPTINGGSVNANSGGFGALAFTNATGSSATTTNFYSENAYFANFSSLNIDLTNLVFSNGTGTNATTTNLFAENGRFTNLLADNFSLDNFTFSNATGTSATTTNFYSSRGLFGGQLSFTGTDHVGLRLNNLSTLERDLVAAPLGSLIYNTTASKLQVYNGSWKNVGNPEIGSEVTLGTSGSVLFVDNSGNLAQDNANFSWDDTLNLLGTTNLSFVSATGTNATTTNIYISGRASTTDLRANTAALGSLSANSVILNNLLAIGSTTLQSFTASNSTSTNATSTNLFTTTANTTNLFATNATVGTLSSGLINGQTISSSANFTGTLTATGGLTTLSNLLLSGSTTLQNLTFQRATGTAATTTNFYSSTGSFGSLRTTDDIYVGGALTVAGSLTSSISNGQIQFLAVPQGTSINQGTVYINPASAGTNNVLLGLAVNGTEKLRIDAEGDVQLIGTVNSTNTTGTNSLSGHLSVLGNTTLGDTMNDTLTVTAGISSDLVPATDNTYALGSTTKKWSSFHATTAFFDQVAVSSSTLSAFIINSDNATSDTEDATLEFSRGLSTPNAMLKWNSSSDRFEFNDFAVYLTNSLTVAGTGNSSVAGLLSLTGTPAGNGLGQGSLYVNPTAASTDRTLVGVGVNGVERFRVDAEGDTTVQGSFGVENAIFDISQDTLTVSDDLQVSGNDIKDSAGTTRLTLGATNTITGALAATGAITGASLDVGAGAITSGLINSQTISAAANFTGTLTAVGGLATLSNLLVTGSTTFQNLTLTNSTTTNATSTNLFVSGLASTTQLRANTALFGGRVGIGTTSPTNLLHAQGGGTASTLATSLSLANTRLTLANPALDLTFGYDTSDNVYIQAINNQNLSGDSLLLNPYGGNIGIGTTTPQSLFHVTGGIGNTVNALHLTPNNNGNRTLVIDGNQINVRTTNLNSLGATVSLLLQSDAGAGAVGIGTTTPASKLQIAADVTALPTTNVYQQLEVTGATTATHRLSLGVLTSTLGGAGAGTGVIQALTNGDNFKNLSLNPSGGSVGIGTTTPNALLTLNDPAATNSLYIGSSTPKFIIKDSGNIGIGTASPNTNLTILGFGIPTSPAGIQVLGNSNNNSDTHVTLSQGSSASPLGDLRFLYAGTDTRTDGRTANSGYIEQGQSIIIRSASNGGVGPSFNFNNSIDVGNGSTGGILFGTNTQGATSTERMRITNTGNVGIGTTTPDTLLGVYQSGTNVVAKFGSNSTGVTDSPKVKIYNGNGFIDLFAAGTSNSYLTGTASGDSGIMYQTGRKLHLGIQSSVNTMTLDSSGNVGIGTTTPANKLDVYGDMMLGTGAASAVLKFLDGNSWNNYRSITDTGTSLSFSNSENGGSFSFSMNAVGTDHFDIISGATTLFKVRDDTGNVGIGTSTPASKLVIVGGTDNISGAFVFDPGVSGQNRTLKFSGITAGISMDTITTSNPSASGILSINPTGGNVGIGTTNPTATLHVSKTYQEPTGSGIASSTVAVFSNNNAANASSSISILSRSSAISGINFGTQLGERSGWIEYGIAAGFYQGMKFGVLGSERMVIDGNGLVGIGSTTPSVGLEVSGKVRLWDPASVSTGVLSASIGQTNATAANGSIALGVLGQGAVRMVVQGDGNVGIGTTSPNQKLEVLGNIGLSPSSFIGSGFGFGCWTCAASTTLKLYDSVTGDTTLQNGFPTGDIVLLPGTSGNVGIGTSVPASPLHVAVDQGRTSYTGTGSTTILANGVSANNGVSSLGLGVAGNVPIGIIGLDKTALGSKMFFGTSNSYGSGITNTAMLIDQAGNVGIGTTSPQTALHIGSANAMLRLNTNGTSAGLYGLNDSTGGNVFSLTRQTVGGGSSAGALLSASSWIGFAANQTTGPDPATAHVVINTSGSVGIGTTTPGTGGVGVGTGKHLTITGASTPARLHLNTDAGAGSRYGTTFSSDNNGDLDVVSFGNMNFRTNSANSQNLYLNSAGNVGIGTTTPISKLSLSDSSNNGITFTNTAQSANNKIFSIFSMGSTLRLAPMNDAGSATADGLQIDRSGNVGIGTSTQASKLVINSTNASESLLQIATTTKQNILVVNSAGNVGIGTTTPSANLAVAGNIFVDNNAGTATSTFRGNVHVTNSLQVGSGSTYITTNQLRFSGGGSVTNTSGKLQLQAGGSTSGSSGNGSIYFLDSAANTVGRFDTTSSTTPLGIGTGADGAISLTNGASNNCNTTALAAARTSGDCISKGLSITAPAATTTMPLSSITGLAVNDEVLIIQMNGTGAGNYEFMTIDSIIGSTLVFDNPLAKTYTIDGASKAQIVRVPQYTTITLSNSGTTLTTSAWNGTTGGVLPFRANSTVTIGANTSITVSGLGMSGASTVTGGNGQAACSGGCAGTGSAGNAGSTGQSPFGGTAAAGGAIGGNPGVGGAGGGFSAGGAGGTGGGGAGGTYATAGSNGTTGVSGAGGGGGSGAAGAGGTGAAGAGGTASSTTYGSAALATLFAGSGGGSGASGAGGGAGGGDGTGGSSDAGGNGGTGGAGGAGGGVLFMEVHTINNSGGILANGIGGTSGGNGVTPANSPGGGGGSGGGAGGAAGGGGAGGSVFLKVSNTVSAIGTVTASGGSGGAQGGIGGNGANSAGNGGGGGGAGRTGGTGGSGLTGAGTSGTTAAPGVGGAGGDGRVRCDTPSGSCSTTPAANQNVYSSTGIPTTNGYGVLYIGAVSTVSADLAEYYVTGDRSLSAGDLVCLSNMRLLEEDSGEEIVNQGVLRKCKDKNDNKLLGVISTSPGVALGSIDSETHQEDNRALALSGRVPVKVSTENGEVKIGDHLTSSSIPGVAMKATGFANVIGISLGNFSSTTGGSVMEIPNGTATSTTVNVGKVTVFVNLGQKKLEVNLTEEGKLETETQNFDYDFSGFNLSKVKSLTSLNGKWSLGEDGTASTTKLCIEESCIGEAQLEILLELADVVFGTSTDVSASTTEATTTPESIFGMSQFFERIWSAMIEKFASAANGLGDFFANRVRTKELCVGDEEGVETCLTKAQLDALLANVVAATQSTATSTATSTVQETVTNNIVTTNAPPVIESFTASSTPEVVAPVVEEAVTAPAATSTVQSLVETTNEETEPEAEAPAETAPEAQSEAPAAEPVATQE
jgi:hypothetical protein